jgi:hypothetical protein
VDSTETNPVNTVLWVLLAGCVVTGVLAVITVFTGSLTVAEGISFVGAALAFGLPTIALFNTIKK